MKKSKLMKYACDYYNLTETEILSKSRIRSVVTARHSFFISLKVLNPKLTFQQLVGNINGKNHSNCLIYYNRYLSGYKYLVDEVNSFLRYVEIKELKTTTIRINKELFLCDVCDIATADEFLNLLKFLKL